MHIQKLIMQAAQHAEEQRQAQDSVKTMETFRLLILATTVNDLVNQDAIDKTLQISADKVVQSLINDSKASEEEIEQLIATVNLIKVEIKRLLSESAKIMRVKQ